MRRGAQSRIGPTSTSMSQTWRSSGVRHSPPRSAPSVCVPPHPDPSPKGDGEMRMTPQYVLALAAGPLPRTSLMACWRGHRHQPHVVEDGAHLEARLEAPQRRRRAVGVHAGDQALLARGLDDGVDGGQHLLVGRIQRRRLAEAERQIGRADVDAADALDGQDLLQVVHGLPRLDHGEQQDLLVGLLPVVGAVLRGAVGPEAALAHRRIAARAHQRLGLGLGVDHRADDAHGAGVRARA